MMMLKKKLSCLSLLFILFSAGSTKAQLFQPCPDELVPKYDKDKRMWGYSDLFGIMIMEPIYTKVSPFKGNLAVVQKGNLSGVINCDGMVILPLQYERLTDFRNGKIWAQKGDLWALLDTKGRSVLPHQYKDINPILHTELAWVNKDGKWGLVDEVQGKLLCPLQYDMIQVISVNASLVKAGAFYGVANHVNCNYLLPLNLEHVKRLTQHELLFEQNKKWGIFHISGKMISEPQYDSIGLSLQNLFIVKKQNKYGLVDQQGLVKLPIEYEAIGDFSAGYAPVLQKGLYGYTTRFGKVYIAPTYEAVKPFTQSQAAVKKNGKWGIIDVKNQAVVPFEFDDISTNKRHTLWVLKKGNTYQLFPVASKQPFSAGLTYDKVYADDTTQIIRVVREGQYYFYNAQTMSNAFSTEFEQADQMLDDAAIVKQTGKYGVIGVDGKFILATEFDEIIALSGSKQKEWLVKKNGLWGLRTATKMVWPETYEWVYPCGNGLFKVKKGGKFGAVNYRMEALGEISYDNISYATQPEWPAVVTKSKKKGLLQNNGQLIAPVKYDSLAYAGEQQFKAWTGKTLNLINAKGEAVKTKWSDAGEWGHGLIAFQVKDKWGFATAALVEAIPPQFDKAGVFIKGLAPAAVNNKTGVIDKTGKWIVEPTYDGFIQSNTKAIVLTKGDKQYAVSERGKVLIGEGKE